MSRIGRSELKQQERERPRRQLVPQTLSNVNAKELRMTKKVSDWAAIAQSPRFVELHRKKTAFLVGLWLFGTLSYFLLPLGVAYTPAIFKAKLLGRLNFAYFFCLYQFV